MAAVRLRIHRDPFRLVQFRQKVTQRRFRVDHGANDTEMDSGQKGKNKIAISGRFTAILGSGREQFPAESVQSGTWTS